MREKLLQLLDRTRRRKFVALACCSLAAASLIGLLGGRNFWLLDHLSHFRAQYVLGLLALTPVALLLRMPRCASLSITLSLLQFGMSWPLYAPVEDAPMLDARPVRAMLVNVLSINNNYDLVLQEIEKENPDILLLEEVTETWLAQLSNLKNTYPYRLERPRTDNFGIALLSKFPFREAYATHFDQDLPPSVYAACDVEGEVLHVLGTHPLSPISRTNTLLRNDQLDAIPSFLNTLDGPKLLIGDLNTTPWSYTFRDLLTDAGLKDSMLGMGYQASWPTFMPLAFIPLDHALVSKDIAVVSRKTGRHIGSDHLPLIVDIALDPPVQQAMVSTPSPPL